MESGPCCAADVLLWFRNQEGARGQLLAWARTRRYLPSLRDEVEAEGAESWRNAQCECERSGVVLGSNAILASMVKGFLEESMLVSMAGMEWTTLMPREVFL